MSTSKILAKLNAYKKNPETFQALSSTELADLVILVLSQVRTIQDEMESKRLDVEKKFATPVEQVISKAKKDNKTLIADVTREINALLARGNEALNKTTTELEAQVQQAIANIRDGDDGIVTEKEITRAAEIALGMLELPDFDALVTEAITSNSEAIRNALELLSGEDRYKVEINDVQGLKEALEQLNAIRVAGGGTIGKNQVYNFIRQAIADGTISGGGGASTFIDLTDTPATYTGQAGKSVVVNGTEDGLEFTTPPGGGDMLASVYDPANKAEQVLTISDATTTPTADKTVKRDANANVFANNVFTNLTSTVSAGGTTVLTVASARVQRLTGSSSQTFQLPDATTLPLSSIFEFDNNSSSSLIITNAGAVTQYTVPAGGAVLCIVTSIGTANGAWQFHALTPGSVTWGSGITGLVMNSVLTTSPSVGSGASSAAAPSFIPQRGANATGFGGDGTKLFASIAGAAALTVEAAGTTAPKFTATTDNAYDATAWNGSLRLVTENAIRDKIESLGTGITRSITVTSGNVTAGSAANTDYVYMVAGAHTISLPAAAGNTNSYVIKNNHTADITIDTVGSETIEGSASILVASEDAVEIMSDGTNYRVIGN